MHRRKDIYGDDADSFRPSRWDPDNKEGPDLRAVGWGYLPFNGGPRVCPGRTLTLHSAFRASLIVCRRLCATGGFVYGYSAAAELPTY